VSDNELPGMWEEADFTGGQDEVRPSSADTHRDPYRGTGLRGKSTSPEAEALEEANRSPVDPDDYAQGPEPRDRRPATLKDGTHVEHMSPDHNIFLCRHVDCQRDAAAAAAAANQPGVALVQKQLPADALLGEVTTRSLLEELRLRGDFLMTVMPTTERGQDGAVLSAIATAVLKSSTPETLETVRGK